MYKSGFTLIEIIVYVAILGVVLFFIGGFIFNGINSSSKIETWQDVDTAGIHITDLINTTVQNSIGIDGATGN